MQLADASVDRFILWYRRGVVGLGAVLRIVDIVSLILPYEWRLGSMLFAFGLGMPPYLALAVVAKWVHSRSTLVVIGLVAAIWDAATIWDVAHPSRSTAAIALVTQPILATVVLVPLALLIGYAARQW